MTELLPTWEAQVDLFTAGDAVLETWLDIEALEAQSGVLQYRGHGYNQDGDDGAHVDVRFWLQAADEAAARAVVRELVDRECGRVAPGLAADPRTEVAVDLKQLSEQDLRDDWDEDGPKAGWVPDSFEPAAWDCYRPTADDRALRIVATSFPLDIGRVDVEEAADRVTVTVYDLYPGFEQEEGVHMGVPAMAVQRDILVPLNSPLAGRPVHDGTLSRTPADVRPSNAANHGRRELASEAELAGIDFRELKDGGGRTGS